MEQNSRLELRLIPRGQGFNAADHAKLLDPDSDEAKEITASRKSFQRTVTGKPTDAATRMTRDERPFVSKICFVHNLPSKAEIHDKAAMLLSLLADRATLFSRQYQVYRTDHAFYRAWRKEYSQTKEDERRNCGEALLVKQQAGHYKPVYNERDYMEWSDYTARRDELEACWSRFRKWKFEHYEGIFQRERRYETFSDDPFSAKDRKEMAGIFSATKDFFQGKPIKEGYVKNIIEYIKGCPNEELHPFHYLMVCVARKECLFLTQTTIYGYRVLHRCRQPYFISKPMPLQRKERIVFLDELNHSFGLNRENRSKNWNAFLQVHGTRIESPAELEQWRKIIYDENGTTREDIPPIELTLLCIKNLRACVPVEHDNLYCYRGGSVMHMGGFKRFLDDDKYKKVVDECAEKIRWGASKYNWPRCEKSYLKEWARLECNIAYIQEWCRKSTKAIRWGRGLNKSMKEFCSMELQRWHRPQAWLDRTTEELKLLLVETALRQVLKDKAVDILAKETQETFNQNSKFKVYLTNFRKLIPD